MAVAVPGVTTVFTLNATSPTQLANANSGRQYLIITNYDLVATVWIGFGTNNTATVGMIPIPPSAAAAGSTVPNVISYLELTIPVIGDVSAIASAGNPLISYTER